MEPSVAILFDLLIPLQNIAVSFCFHLGRLDKLQGKVMTHSEKLEWWIILRADCVTHF